MHVYNVSGCELNALKNLKQFLEVVYKMPRNAKNKWRNLIYHLKAYNKQLTSVKKYRLYVNQVIVFCTLISYNNYIILGVGYFVVRFIIQKPPKTCTLGPSLRVRIMQVGNKYMTRYNTAALCETGSTHDYVYCRGKKDEKRRKRIAARYCDDNNIIIIMIQSTRISPRVCNIMRCCGGRGTYLLCSVLQQCINFALNGGCARVYYMGTYSRANGSHGKTIIEQMRTDSARSLLIRLDTSNCPPNLG